MFADSVPSLAPTVPGSPGDSDRSAQWLRRIWVATVVGMVLLAIAWMSYQTYRYFLVKDPNKRQRITVGAIDIRNRHFEAKSWFQQEAVYVSYGQAVYPPASYTMLGLLIAGLPWSIVKPLWFLGSLVSVGILSRQLVRFSLVESPREKWFVAVLPWAMYATGAALGNGQFVLFVLPLALNAVLMLAEPHRTPRATWIGIGLMVAALVQPTIAAPFFWLILFRIRWYQPAMWVVVIYLVLTAIAMPFQVNAQRIVPPEGYGGLPDPRPAVEPGSNIKRLPPREGAAAVRSPLLRWLRRGTRATYFGSIDGGYANVHSLLATPELAQWNVPASLAILGILGVWIFLHRRGDLWLLLGGTAIVARIWIYHRWYDDLLLILPLITLCRVTKQPQYSPWLKTVAAALFLWLWMFLLAPGMLYTLANPKLPVAIQVTGWLATLVFLALLTARERQTSASPADPSADPVSPSTPLLPA